MTTNASTAPAEPQHLIRGLGLWDATMIVAGSMIGSGIFIVSADIARQVGSTGGLLLTWVLTGILTVVAALSYGELAAMMPQAGGQYVYLREAYSPLWGFLYGWTSFLVIQTGTIAAVAVAFSRYLGVLLPGISPTVWIVPPIDLSSHYGISLSTQQLAAVLLVILLTLLNTRGLWLGKLIQNVFTSVKTLSIIALIFMGLILAPHGEVLRANFSGLWTPHNVSNIKPDFSWFPEVTVSAGVLGAIVAFGVAQVGSLFSADAWNNVTFTAGEVKNPRRNIPLSLAAGTGMVVLLYFVANLAYLALLPLEQIQKAPDDRVATAAIEVAFSGAGPVIMAIAIMISTFGCNNGLILAGARVYFAMARDRLFFQSAARLNGANVPAAALLLQCAWSCLLVLPRTRLRDASTGQPLLDPVTQVPQYGNLYSTLLDYVIFAVLIFYVLTICGIFVLRRKRPDMERPYRALGYPWAPALYVLLASAIMVVLLVYKTATSIPGLVIVLTGIPVYWIWRRAGRQSGTAPKLS